MQNNKAMERWEKVLGRVDCDYDILAFRKVYKNWRTIIDEKFAGKPAELRQLCYDTISESGICKIAEKTYPKLNGVYELGYSAAPPPVWIGIGHSWMKWKTCPLKIPQLRQLKRRYCKVVGCRCEIVCCATWGNLLAYASKCGSLFYHNINLATTPFITICGTTETGDDQHTRVSNDHVSQIAFWYTEGRVITVLLQSPSQKMLFFEKDENRRLNITNMEHRSRYICVKRNRCYSVNENSLTMFVLEGNSVEIKYTLEFNDVKLCGDHICRPYMLDRGDGAIPAIHLIVGPAGNVRRYGIYFTNPAEDTAIQQPICNVEQEITTNLNGLEIDATHYILADKPILISTSTKNHLLAVSIDCGPAAFYWHSDHYMGGFVTTALFHAGLMIFGLDNAKLYIFRLDNIDDMLNLNFGALSAKTLILDRDESPGPIIFIDVTESEGALFIVAHTIKKIYVIEYVQI